jgi:uroporphyrinogen III methyltransferase/synthase
MRLSGNEWQVKGKPLAGRRIAVTRPEAQVATLASGLRELGAEARSYPTIRIAEPTDPKPLQVGIEGLEDYGWIVFTSANGVDRFWRQLQTVRGDISLPSGMEVAAIGPATAQALEQRGARPRIVPGEYVAEAVADALTAGGAMSGAHVLLPRAAGARQVLPERLRAAGAAVDEVVAYESVANLDGIAALRAAVEGGEVDMVTFTAASTVRCYVDEVGPELGEASVAVIGPITAKAARASGVHVDVEAREYTVPGLLDAICDYYKGMEGEEQE